jgi:hypothetical protein
MYPDKVPTKNLKLTFVGCVYQFNFGPRAFNKTIPLALHATTALEGVDTIHQI